MKNKKKIIAIITSWLCAVSAAAGTAVLPLSESAFAATADEKTFDGKHDLDESVNFADYDVEIDDSDVKDKLYEVFEKACKKDIDEITYGDLLKISSLNLSKMELTDIPLCLKYMTNLRTLDLSNNNLQNTDNVKNLDLRALKKLNKLDLSYNYLTSVPSWYVLDGIKTKKIDHNLLSGDDQRSIKALTPVYYFMNGEELVADDFMEKILADIVLDNGDTLPDFLYDPKNYGDDQPLTIDISALEKYISDEDKITFDGDYTSVTITVSLPNSDKNPNAKTAIKVYLLDGSSPTTVKARLETLLDEVKDYPSAKNNYTARSWTNFESAQKTAQSIFDYPNSDAEMLKTALEQLAVAKSSLVPGIDDKTKTLLTSLTTVGKTYKEEDYTPNSWNSLQSAIARISEISADKNATLTSAKSAILAFQNAQKGLERALLSVPSTIPKADFERIFGENSKYVSAKGTTRGGRGYDWRFNGTSLTAPADFNPAVTDTPANEDAILLESGRAGGYLAFSTEQSGAFPGKGILSINVSDKFTDGTYYLYKWGTSGDFQSEVTVKNGVAAAEIFEGGTYYISNVLQRYDLSSDKLTIDAEKHAITVPLCSGYNVSSFKRLFKYGSGVTVYDADGKPVSSSSRIKTGMSVSSPNGASYAITVMGDVNDDGYVNAKDALAVLKYTVSVPIKKPAPTSDSAAADSSNPASGSEETAPEKEFGVGVTGINVADVNGDGYINAKDALAILRASAR